MARLDMVFAEQTGRAVEAVDLLVLGAAETVQSRRRSARWSGGYVATAHPGGAPTAALIVYDASGQTVVSTDPDVDSDSTSDAGNLVAALSAGSASGADDRPAVPGRGEQVERVAGATDVRAGRDT